MLDADAALLRLKEGNEKFRKGASHIEVDEASRLELVEQQKPFAIILGCSDSRVPSELVFAQGLGDLFVIRVAGNIAAPSQIGSIEFAADKFASNLVVVLGHSHCGAIKATISAIEEPEQTHSPNLSAIVNSIKPGIQSCLDSGDSLDDKVQKAVRANVQSTIDKLVSDSEILRQKISEEGLKIVGAEYCLESGVVEFFQ
ncbi:MAG: carbonic anhydrase [Pseudomonadales bacterium]|nr:carbonic anhydrase [Pseudomonadales bacterium]